MILRVISVFAILLSLQSPSFAFWPFTKSSKKAKLDQMSEDQENKKVDTVVSLNTDKGEIKIKLHMDEAPATAGNFKDLVERGFYDGLTFHRIVPGFVIQGGCPKGDGTGSFIDPATDEVRYIHMEKSDLKHDKEGVVAMARSSHPDSASSQFFIDLKAQPGLDAGGYDPNGYAVFGQVIDGMDVVHEIVEDNEPPFPGSDATDNPVKIIKASIIN